MGITATTGTLVYKSVTSDPGVGGTAYYDGDNNSWAGNTEGDQLRKRVQKIIDGAQYETTTNNGVTTAVSGSYNSDDNGQSELSWPADEGGAAWRALVRNDTDSYWIYGNVKYFKSHAVAMTTAGVITYSITSTTAAPKVGWRPNTTDSTATCQLQYKLSTDSTWTVATTDSGNSGYDVIFTEAALTGLTPERTYQVRAVYTRNTTNDTSLTSATASFVTLAGTPEVTTVDASSVSHNSATLNATVDHNTKDGDLKWRYIDTASYVGPPSEGEGTEAEYASNPITADGSGSVGISGLTGSTSYTFWAVYDPSEAGVSTVFGDAKTFTTAGDPAVEAADEDHMITQYVDGQYGVATTVYFTLRQPAATSSDLFYTGTAPVQADVKIAKDGVYDSTSDNAPAQVASITQVYSLVVSAAEMQADVVDIIISDAAGSAFRDHHIQIRTQLNLGTVVVNAANKATNTTAMTLTGNGTGAGLSCVGGDNDGKDIDGVLADHTQNYGTIAAYNSSTSVDLDNSTAVNTNDYYNGAIILFYESGTGYGQARVITDYVGADYQATLNRALATAVNTSTKYIIIPGPDTWNISPGAELSALPTAASGFGALLQSLWQRFFYQREQTATAFTMRKVDGSTEFATGAVDDDGTKQTHDALS